MLFKKVNILQKQSIRILVFFFTFYLKYYSINVIVNPVQKKKKKKINRLIKAIKLYLQLHEMVNLNCQ